MSYQPAEPWQEPEHPAAHWVWPVNLWAGEHHRKALPYRQHRYPDGIRVICIDLGPAGHADVMLSGDGAWSYLGRTEAIAHAEPEGRDGLLQLEWLNRGTPCPLPMFALPDGAGYLTLVPDHCE